MKQFHKYVGFFIFCFFLTAAGQAQTNLPKEKKMTGAEEIMLEKAQLMVEEKNYRMALPVFEDLLAKHPGNNTIKFFTALCYYSRADKHPLMLQYLNEVYAANKKA